MRGFGIVMAGGFMLITVVMKLIAPRIEDTPARSYSDSCVYSKDRNENDLFIRGTARRMIAIVTLHELVCATARSAPNIEYLELGAHPDHRME